MESLSSSWSDGGDLCQRPEMRDPAVCGAWRHSLTPCLALPFLLLFHVFCSLVVCVLFVAAFCSSSFLSSFFFSFFLSLSSVFSFFLFRLLFFLLPFPPLFFLCFPSLSSASVSLLFSFCLFFFLLVSPSSLSLRGTGRHANSRIKKQPT